MSEDTQREMTLAETARQYGHEHRAAKEYTRLSHAIRMLDQCKWWEVWRKHNIKHILIDTIKKIDTTK